MKKIIDHLGREVVYSYPPKRIISLCPGITETLYTFQLAETIVGRTRYCIYPKDLVEQATIVGGTKQIEMEKIHQLQPDLVIVEKEENTEEIVKMIEAHYPVYVAEVQSVEGAYRMVRDIGMLTNRQQEANALMNQIEKSFSELPTVNELRAAYVIWRKPYMVVGANTYINDVLNKMGFVNPFAESTERYPAVDRETLADAQLDYLFLASEPFPYSEKFFKEFEQFLPHTKLMIVDGEMFWYGAKMREAIPYFHQTFNKLHE